MTGDHSDIQARLRVAEVCAGYIALGARALAGRMGVSERHARRLLERTLARQHDPAVLRVVKLPVPIGSGARRAALHILWPVADVTQLSDHGREAFDPDGLAA